MSWPRIERPWGGIQCTCTNGLSLRESGLGALLWQLHRGDGLGERARHEDTDALEHAEEDTTADGAAEGRLWSAWGQQC